METSNRLTIGPIVSGIITTCRSVLAISQSLVCFTMAMDRIPDAQMPQKRTVVYLSGRGQHGQMFLSKPQ